MKYFGMNRVLEPKGSVPVSAWKIDNNPEVRAGEIKIKLEAVHIEWDSFQQICSHCGYDEIKIRARIMQIINERGKLQNPYTSSGGMFLGTVEQIGENVDLGDIKIGDRVTSVSSLTGMAISIDEIGVIDFNYGHIKCSGYLICFESMPLMKYDFPLEPKHFFSAMDEEGNFLLVKEIADSTGFEKVVIIGRTPILTLLYAQLFVNNSGKNPEIIAIVQKDARSGLSESEMRTSFLPLIKNVIFLDLSKPLEAYENILFELGHSIEVDAVINTEDITGSEALSTFLVKEGGSIFYTSLKNNYSAGMLVSNTLGKVVIPYALDGYVREAPEFAIKLVSEIQINLEFIDALYESQKSRLKGIATKENKRNAFNTVEHIEDFIFASPVTRSMLDEVLNVARYDCNVIIEGETGVGKEKVFNLLHQYSPRKGKACIKINCATIQENLAESEFFGYEKGAFTGAQSSGKEGYFELANNGTLFLDEIGSLSLSMQSKLLRVLQENSFYRVGGVKQLSTNVRVICANNVPLKQLVDQGKFREDLYYRLNICLIDVPPLRERREDITCLAENFIEGYSKKYGVEKELSPDALGRLESYHWPGNVRELENTIHRLYINERGSIIDGDAVEQMIGDSAYSEMIVNIRKAFDRVDSIDFNSLMDEQEKRIIAYALKKEGSTRKAAAFLCLPQATLARKKVKYGL